MIGPYSRSMRALLSPSNQPRALWLSLSLRAPLLTRTCANAPTTEEKQAADVATIRLYRILLKQVTRLPESSSFLLQPVFRNSSVGGTEARVFTAANNTTVSTWYNRVLHKDVWNHVSSEEGGADFSVWTDRVEVMKAVRGSFRTMSSTRPLVELHRTAIDAVQTISTQVELIRNTSVSVEHGLKISATSLYFGQVPSQTRDGLHHRYGYRIRIENVSENAEDCVQLLGRIWNIQEIPKDGSSSDGKSLPDPLVVHAPTNGAVGHQPVLEPGQVFEYVSYCELNESTGKLRGSLHFAEVPKGTPSVKPGERESVPPAALSPDYDQSKLFSVPVAEFRLEIPSWLQIK